MKKVLVDLDCLLDTRIAIIQSIDPDVAKSLFSSEHYHLREVDDWETLTQGKITNAQFAEHWKNRTVDLVREHAMLTNVFAVLSKVFADYHVNMLDGVEKEEICLCVNLHPYDFTEEEKNGMVSILKELFFEDLVVTFEWLSLDARNPKHLTENFHAVFMYEFVSWMKKHYIGITNLPMVVEKIDVRFPRIFEKASSLPVEKKQEQVDMWISLWFNHISIDFIHPHWMSIVSKEFFRHSHPEILEDIKAAP